MKPIALYARVSTRDQNPSLQLRALRQYARGQGGSAVEFLDRATGASAERPAFTRLMDAATRREVSAVVCWKFDRVGRSVSHLAQTLRELEALGVGFVSLTEAIDTRTPAGRMVFHMLAALAEFERDLIRERVKAGLAAAREDGKRIGRPPLELDEQEVLDLAGAGLSAKAIARTVVAKAGGAFRHPSATVVREVLRRHRAEKVSARRFRARARLHRARRGNEEVSGRGKP